MNEVLANARRIVIKVGSSLVTNEGQGLDSDAIGNWCGQLAALASQGRELVMVSSGAIAEGMTRLGWSVRPKQLHELQAAAAVGQMGLVHMYESMLRVYGVKSAQVLLTHSDLADRERYLNARSTLTTLLKLNVIPIINENDTVVNDEIKFGDNDTLGALVANLIEADALVILTDQHGLYSEDPRKNPQAQLITNALAGDPALERMAGGAGSTIGRGGMITKILAAKRAARSGASTVIAWGREKDILLRLCAGEPIGTALGVQTPKMAARKQWMMDQLQLRGALVLDAGARSKICGEGKSLLPVGVLEVKGDFHRGDVISLLGADGVEVARGLINYSSGEARLIARKSSNELEATLGFSCEPEMVHRDNMVILEDH